MNKLFTSIAAVSLGLTMAIGVGTAVGTSVNREAVEARAETSTINITLASSGVTATAYASSAKSWSQDGVSFSLTNVIKGTPQGGSVQGLQAKNGDIWNTSAIPGSIRSIVFTQNGGSVRNWTLYLGTSSEPSTTYGSTGTSWSNITGSNTYFKIHCPNNAYYFTNLAITYEVAAQKDLSSIALSGTYPTTFTQGDTFSHSGMVVTATYSDSSTADVTSSATWSSPDMSTAGQKTVTVSYTEGGVTKTATYNIQVNDPRTVASLTVYDENLDELEDGGEFTLAASSGTSISTDVMCEVTYSPSGTDGNTVITSAAGTGFSVSTSDHETYTLTFSANGDHEITFAAYEDENVSITVTYHVSGLPNVTYVTDVIDNALTGVGDVTTYAEWSGKSDQSDAVYAGQSAGQHSTVQLRSNNSNSGVITTTTAGGVVTTIKATFNSNTADSRKVDFYGKNTAYSSATDLYNDSLKGTSIGSVTYDGSEVEYTIDVSDDTSKQFAYIGFRSNSGALYLDSVEITWAIEQEIIDTLESVEIDGALTTSTYYEGQTISLDGLTVYGNYTHAGKVSLMGKSGLTFSSTPATATSTSLDEITVSASFEGESTSETYGITVNPDEVTALSWSNRGYEDKDYFLSGKTLRQCIDTSKWTFSATWASGLPKAEPSFGTGADDVHVGLYTTYNPASETATALTDNYVLSSADDGKYLVAFYKGTHSSSNRQLFVTESLNSIVKPAEGDPGYFLVKDASNLSAGDTVVIAAFNYNYAMSTTQNTNNRGSDTITKDSSDSSMSFTTSIQTFTLETGTIDGTWAFKTDDGYIYAASSSSNHLRTKSEKDDNCSFELIIGNTGITSAIAQGNYSRNVLSFNNSNNPKIFSCYSAIQGSGQIAIYKYTEPMDEPINNVYLKAQHVVVEYAYSFIDALDEICVAYGSTDPDALSEAWGDLSGQYDDWINNGDKGLTGDDITHAKDLFANATASKTGDVLQRMLDQYDWIVSHYGTLENFLHDDAGRDSLYDSTGRVAILADVNSSNIIPIIVIVSLISVSAIGGYFYIRRRKEQ